MKKYIIAMIALMGLLLIGGAFATEESAATIQATHLQLHIDEAITVGANVIAKISANSSTNVSTAQLQDILDKMTALKATIDVNSSTVAQIQDARKSAMELVKEFRDTVKDLLGDDVKAEIKAKAEKEFKAKFEGKIKMGEDMQKRFNLKALEHFAERQQHLALNLSDDENVSLTPEFAAKIADIRARIEANQLSKDQIAEIRTKIKVDAQGLKADREALVADIREDILKNRVEMLEQLISAAAEANVSTSALVDARTQLLGLLDAYTSGNISAIDFGKEAQTTYDVVAQAIADPALNKIRAEVRVETKDDRVEIRAESKAEIADWREARKDMMNNIGNMRGDIKEIRSEIRDRINGTRMEVREKMMKDGSVESRLRIRADASGNSGSDSDDSNEVESDDDVSVSAQI